jgi:hypothetical protein
MADPRRATVRGMLGVKLIVASVGLGVSIHLYLWRKRSRAGWRDYDDAHDQDPPLRRSRASSRARRER